MAKSHSVNFLLAAWGFVYLDQCSTSHYTMLALFNFVVATFILHYFILLHFNSWEELYLDDFF